MCNMILPQRGLRCITPKVLLIRDYEEGKIVPTFKKQAFCQKNINVTGIYENENMLPGMLRKLSQSLPYQC